MAPYKKPASNITPLEAVKPIEMNAGELHGLLNSRYTTNLEKKLLSHIVFLQNKLKK